MAALADACNANGQWEQALSVYSNLVKDDPINPDYFEQKARLEEQHQQTQSALSDYKSALRLSPGDDSYGQSILRVLESSPGHPGTEITALEPIVYSAPSNTVLSTQLSHLYSGPDANQKRIDLYTRLLKSVSIPFYHRALAGALEATGQKAEAAVQYLILAHELEKSGDTPGAAVDYRATLRVDPNNTEAQAGLEHIQATAKSNSKPALPGASPAPRAGMQAPPVTTPSAGPKVIPGPAGIGSQPASPAPGNPPARTIP
jgi:tetratricopeptide (TPR) repeat protein